ncbi:MAG: Flavin-dependent oxidoreductase, luciferase family [Chloroflexi bacterium]|nr:MAG: Flavin-dependent oxidoreductase, luciferase family [Chloroflexota bacterium]
MKFGLRYCNTGRFTDPVNAVELLQAAEQAGFDSAWTIEHTVVPGGYESVYPYADSGRLPGREADFVLPDPLIWLAYVASATRTIKLGTAILILPQHNPVITAKQVATLDALSGGRVLLGIGVGWLKEEFDAIGAPFADRGRRTDEYVAAMRELWSSSAPTFRGEFVEFENAYCNPKPVNGAVPIIVGGDTKLAARRAGRLGDGYLPARGANPEMIELARRTAEEHGRDPNALEISTSLPDDLAEIPALAAAGVHRLLVPVTAAAGLQAVVSSPDDALAFRTTIERYADA